MDEGKVLLIAHTDNRLNEYASEIINGNILDTIECDGGCHDHNYQQNIK